VIIKHYLHVIFKHYLVSIRQWTKDKPFWGCCLKILLRGRTKEFQQYVARYVPAKTIDGIDCVTRNLAVSTMGTLNPKIIIMYLERDSGSGGFCAEWVYWLNRVSFSDKMGFKHCINWIDSQFYKEEELENGNIFEYFFEQPADISVEETLKSQNVIFDYNSIDYGYYDSFAPGRNDDYIFSETDIINFSKIQKKYIRLNECLKNEIDLDIINLLKRKKVLAVHARGADAKIPYNNHPIPVTIEDYIDNARREMNAIQAEKIFLATDDNNILKRFVEEFGDKLLYYNDVERSDGVRMSCYGESNRFMHHYKLGKEIIRDVYTMAACQGLVCSTSYVSYIVRILKKSMDCDYEVIYCIKTKLRKKGLNLTDPKAISSVEKIWNQELKDRKKG